MSDVTTADLTIHRDGKPPVLARLTFWTDVEPGRDGQRTPGMKVEVIGSGYIHDIDWLLDRIVYHHQKKKTPLQMVCPTCGWKGSYADVCPTPGCITLGSEMQEAK